MKQKHKMNLLLLEDDPDDFYLMKESLLMNEDANITILHAERLSKALDVAGKSAIDIAVLDLNLPDSIGLDTFISFHQRYPSIPVIIMSGVNDVDLAVSAVQKGARDFICKGEAASVVMSKINRYVINDKV